MDSFSVDHDILGEGMYLSKVHEGNNFFTWDLRFVRPNTKLLDPAAVHTIEHILAVHMRKNLIGKEEVVYFGPMGCLTGFYAVTRNIDKDKVQELLVEAVALALVENKVPFGTTKECGSADFHNLELAKEYLAGYLKVLKDWKGENRFNYPSAKKGK